jgi:hypothetical protein
MSDQTRTAAEIMAETQYMLRVLAEDQAEVRAMLEARRTEIARENIRTTFANRPQTSNQQP